MAPARARADASRFNGNSGSTVYEKMIESPVATGVKRVVGDLVAGEQGYVDPKRNVKAPPPVSTKPKAQKIMREGPIIVLLCFVAKELMVMSSE